MIKVKLLLIIVLVTVIYWVFTVPIFAQDSSDTDVPSSYAGLKNPFPWDDVLIQESGKEIYQRFCLSCHGFNGDSIREADFSLAEYAPQLEANPDLHFWILSEGESDKGMPGYKTALTEDQRWQVLTYLWSLSKIIPPVTTPPTDSIAPEGLTLLLITAEQAQSGQIIFLTAVLRDAQDKPVANARITYFIRVNFFISGIMEIGEAITDKDGTAIFEYIPRQTGEIEIIASYETLETTETINLVDTNEIFYQTEVGLEGWALGEETIVSIPLFSKPEGGSDAPKTVLRLPTGVLVWGTPLLLTVIAIWVMCFYTVYQVYRIPAIQEINGTNTRIVPLIILAVITVLGILLSLMLITGPYSR